MAPVEDDSLVKALKPAWPLDVGQTTLQGFGVYLDTGVANGIHGNGGIELLMGPRQADGKAFDRDFAEGDGSGKFQGSSFKNKAYFSELRSRDNRYARFDDPHFPEAIWASELPSRLMLIQVDRCQYGNQGSHA